MGPSLLCVPLLPVLKQTRHELELRGVDMFAYLSGISIDMIEVTTDIVEVVEFLRRELANIGIATKPRKTVALPRKGHIPTLEEMVFLGGVGVYISDRGGVKLVAVPIGNRRIRDEERDVDRRKLWTGATCAYAAMHINQTGSQADCDRLHGPANSIHRAGDGPGVISAGAPKGKQHRGDDVRKRA